MEVTCSGCPELKLKIFWYLKRFWQKIAKFLILNTGQAPIKIGFRDFGINEPFQWSESYGGVQGAHSLNERFFGILKDIDKKLQNFWF